MEGNSHSPVFVAVIDDEVDLAITVFKEALSQINGVQVFAFIDPLLALEHFKANHHELHGRNIRLQNAYHDWDGIVK